MVLHLFYDSYEWFIFNVDSLINGLDFLWTHSELADNELKELDDNLFRGLTKLTRL